jgi:signal transduction histidine kinase
MRTRLRQVSDARMMERQRIARDLHDTLLQSVQGLIMWVHAATEHIKHSTDPASGVQLLEDALTMAQQAVAEGRDRILELRREAPQLAFAEALRQVAQQVSISQTTEYVVHENGVEPFWPSGAKDEAYWITREAIANAAYHAKPKAITVSIHYGPRYLSIEVEDDGCGISASVLAARGRQGHWGMKGMYERAKLIKAELTIVSDAQQGTIVKLTLPMILNVVGDLSGTSAGVQKRAASPTTSAEHQSGSASL